MTTTNIQPNDSFKVVNLPKNIEKSQKFWKNGNTYKCTKVVVFQSTIVDDEIYVDDNWISSQYCIKL